MSRLSSSNLAILRPGIPSHASEWLGYEGSVTLKLLIGTTIRHDIAICHQYHYDVYADEHQYYWGGRHGTNIPRCSDQSPARTATRKMHTIHDKKFVLDCGTAVATTSRNINGFGRSSLRRKPNTTSEELRAAVESTRPARNLEIYLWSRILLDQRPGRTSPLFLYYDSLI